VVKSTTTKIILFVTISKGWCLTQLSVKNVFHHGIVEEDVYVEQSPGYEHKSPYHYNFKLDKAYYGLKQAPRAWF
jgi:hypothetical protein